MIRLVALVALMPVAIGPIPQSNMILTASACLVSGPRTMEIPLHSDDQLPVSHQAGCHALCPRKKIDPAQ